MAHIQRQILQAKILTQTTINFNLSLKAWYLLYHIYLKREYVDIKKVDFNDKSCLDLALNYMLKNLEEKIKLSQNATTLYLNILDKELIWNIEEYSLRKLVSKSKNLKTVILEFQISCQNYHKKYFASSPSTLCHYSNMISDFKEIENLTINFQYDKLDDKAIELLFNNMNRLQNLTRLNLFLGDNCFGDQGITILSQQISQIKNLCYLNINLYNVKIKNEGAINLAQNIAMCLNLREIQIDNSRNQITQEAIFSYFDLLTKNSTLQSLNLDLYGNKIGSQEIDIFPKQLANLISLSLSLRYTELGNKGLKCLSQVLGLSQQIENLYLKFYNCNFNDDAINCFSQSLQKCQKLTKLQLFFSSLALCDQTLSDLIKSTSKCLDLKQLSLSFESCKIQDQALLAIGEKFQQIKNLSHIELNLNKNEFKDQALQKFGQQIAQMKYIKLLNISVKFTQCYQIFNFASEMQRILSLNHLVLSFPNTNNMKLKKKILDYLKRKSIRLVFLKINMY
ncbi:hypothetical protein ABPG72_007801 [Tetrahymena utriculariae]